MHIWSSPLFCLIAPGDTDTVICASEWPRLHYWYVLVYWCKVISFPLLKPYWITVYLIPWLQSLSTHLGLKHEVIHQPNVCLGNRSCKSVSTPSHLASSKSSSIAWLFIQEYVNAGLKIKCWNFRVSYPLSGRSQHRPAVLNSETNGVEGYLPSNPNGSVCHSLHKGDTIHILLLYQLYIQNTEKTSNKMPST